MSEGNRRGDPDHCAECKRGPATRLRGYWYFCPLHHFVAEITMRAQRSDILVIKNGEFWDYKGELLAAFIEEQITRFGVSFAGQHDGDHKVPARTVEGK